MASDKRRGIALVGLFTIPKSLIPVRPSGARACRPRPAAPRPDVCTSASSRARRGRAAPGSPEGPRPASSRCVANVCRSACGEISAGSPAARRRRFNRRAIERVVSRPPRALTKRGSPLLVGSESRRLPARAGRYSSNAPPRPPRRRARCAPCCPCPCTRAGAPKGPRPRGRGRRPPRRAGPSRREARRARAPAPERRLVLRLEQRPPCRRASERAAGSSGSAATAPLWPGCARDAPRGRPIGRTSAASRGAARSSGWRAPAMERSEVRAHGERVDFESGVFAAGSLANSCSQKAAKRSRSARYARDRPRGEAPLVGEIAREPVDRARERDHGTSVTPRARYFFGANPRTSFLTSPSICSFVSFLPKGGMSSPPLVTVLIELRVGLGGLELGVREIARHELLALGRRRLAILSVALGAVLLEEGRRVLLARVERDPVPDARSANAAAPESSDASSHPFLAFSMSRRMCSGCQVSP